MPAKKKKTPADEPWNKQYRHCPHCKYKNPIIENEPPPEFCGQCRCNMPMLQAMEEIAERTKDLKPRKDPRDPPEDYLREARDGAMYGITTIEAERLKQLAKDIGALRATVTNYANLVAFLLANDKGAGIFPRDWDETHHQNTIDRSTAALNELEKMYPHTGD